MLVLSRKINDGIVIGDNIVVTIVDIRGDKVRLGIQAPAEVPVHRREVFEAIRLEAVRVNRLGLHESCKPAAESGTATD